MQDLHAKALPLQQAIPAYPSDILLTAPLAPLQTSASTQDKIDRTSQSLQDTKQAAKDKAGEVCVCVCVCVGGGWLCWGAVLGSAVVPCDAVECPAALL